MEISIAWRFFWRYIRFCSWRSTGSQKCYRYWLSMQHNWCHTANSLVQSKSNDCWANHQWLWNGHHIINLPCLPGRVLKASSTRETGCRRLFIKYCCFLSCQLDELWSLFPGQSSTVAIPFGLPADISADCFFILIVCTGVSEMASPNR